MTAPPEAPNDETPMNPAQVSDRIEFDRRGLLDLIPRRSLMLIAALCATLYAIIYLRRNADSFAKNFSTSLLGPAAAPQQVTPRPAAPASPGTGGRR